MIAQLDIDGLVHELTVPTSPRDWPFETVCDFRALDAAFLHLNRETGGSEDVEAQEAIYTALADAVAVVCGDAVHLLPLTTEGREPVQDLFDREYTVQIGDELTQLRLYAHLCTVLRRSEVPTERAGEWTPERLPAQLHLAHDGTRYRIHRDAAARVLAGKPLTVGEAMEVKEYRRVAAERAKAIGPQGAAGDLAALDFTLGLTEVAILVRRPGERLPVEDAERERWLTTRREELAGISLATVMEVRLFLIAAVARWSSSGATATGATVRRLLPSPVEEELPVKTTARRSRRARPSQNRRSR